MLNSLFSVRPGTAFLGCMCVTSSKTAWMAVTSSLAPLAAHSSAQRATSATVRVTFATARPNVPRATTSKTVQIAQIPVSETHFCARHLKNVFHSLGAATISSTALTKGMQPHIYTNAQGHVPHATFSDEADCTHGTHCPANTFQCSKTKCISKSMICDGVPGRVL